MKLDTFSINYCWVLLKTIIGPFEEGILKGFDCFFQHSLVNCFISFYPLLTKVNLGSAMIWHTPSNHHRYGMMHMCGLWHHLSGFIATPCIHSVIITLQSFLDRKNLLICKEDVLIFFPWIVMPGLHSCWDSTRQDENESVKGTFVSSSTLSTCSHLVLKISEICW